jgi:GNAT superfamily N-acetyltransferase
MNLEIGELTAAQAHEATAILAAAFFDDPSWRAIGPSRPAARQRLLSRYMKIVVTEAVRWGAPNLAATEDGELVGLALTFANHENFPPPLAGIREAPPFAMAGPGPALRAARLDAAMKRAHPSHEHLLLWFLAARPDIQRQGVGRALLNRVFEEAADRKLPVFLDTTNPDNRPYYESFGFREIAKTRLPRRTFSWSMLKE